MDIKQIEQEMETNQPATTEAEAVDQPASEQALTETGQVEATEPDYKALYEAELAKNSKINERYVAASKETLKWRGKTKKLETEKAASMQAPAISDEQLKAKYQNWNDLTKSEQDAYRRAENAELRAKAAEEAAAKYDGLAEREQEVSDFLELAEAEGKYPDVREQLDEFRRFATSHRERDLDELAKIFVYDHPKKADKQKPSTPFGNTARNQSETKPRKMSYEQSEVLRKSSPRKYMELLEAGKI